MREACKFSGKRACGRASAASHKTPAVATQAAPAPLDSPFSFAGTDVVGRNQRQSGGAVGAVFGQFKSDVDSQSSGDRKNHPGDKNKVTEVDNNIEVYVLTDSAFTVWQNGYATSSLYESGKVAEGTVQAEIPAGAGIYYLVFSNKSALKTSKAVHATVLLRYKSWLPDWFRRMKDRVSDWVGSD